MIFISQCYGQLSSAVDSMNTSYDLKVKQIYYFKKAKGQPMNVASLQLKAT